MIVLQSMRKDRSSGRSLVRGLDGRVKIPGVTRPRLHLALMPFAGPLLGVVAVVVACTAPSASGSAGDRATAPSGGPSSVPTGTTSSPAAVDTETPIAAAGAFLRLTSARFEMAVDRWKPGQPLEREWEASGVVDPATDRGSMRWRLLFPTLGQLTPPATPQPPFEADILWNATDYWSSGLPTAGEERRWTHATRERARETAIIGRVQEEPLALVRFAAEADPSAVEPMARGTLDGDEADRWLIKVPLDRIRAAYIPPDTYLSVREVFGIASFPLEVWTVDGAIRRVGYVLEREKAPYGGPDRFETYYDWSGFGDPIELVIPPPGQIVDFEG